MRPFRVSFPIARTILVLQLVALLVFYIVVRFSSDLSFSRIAERYIILVAPHIYTENFNRSLSAGQGPVSGVVNKHSIEPGEHFSIALSTSSGTAGINGVLEIYRIGYYGTDDRKLVFRSDRVVVHHQLTSIDSFAVGVPWKREAIDIQTENWDSGYYAFDFVTDRDQRVPDIAYLVVRDPDHAGDILVKLSTNTYQAYNRWGGSSLYRTSVLKGVRKTNIVSFDRPTQTQFYRWEYYYVRWLERYAQEHQLRVGYATNHDLHAYPDIADNYKLLISPGHDEYWSQREFDVHYKRIFEQGKNTLFLSANTAYWRVRYADVNHSGLDRQMLCYKNELTNKLVVGMNVFDPLCQTQSPLPVTGLFRGKAGYPETMLMGVGYESWFSSSKHARYGYKIRTALPWLVEGTGLREGDRVADIVGYEWDNTSLEHKGFQVWSRETAKIPYLPREQLTVVMDGHPVDDNGQPGLAQAVYFESEAGAKVFSAGTIHWAWGLGKPGFREDRFIRLNENLLAWFLDNGEAVTELNIHETETSSDPSPSAGVSAGPSQNR